MTRKKDDGIFSVLEDILPEENIENSSFSFITEFKGNSEEDISEVSIPDELPI